MVDRVGRDDQRTRRRLLGALAGGGTVALGGCLDFVTGEDPATFEASAATVADATLRETKYEHQETRSDTVTRKFEAGGESRSVEVVNKIAEYDRGIDVPGVGRARAAVFTALSTPQVEVLGRTFNPVADMSTDELAAKVQQRYDRIENLNRESSRDVALVGETTTATRYAGDARLVDANATIDVYVTVTEPVEAGSDFVLAFGGYPQILNERRSITAMIEGVDHGGGG